MRFKRVLPVILSLFMVGGAFAGCAKKDDGTKCDGTNHIMAEKPVSDGESGHHSETVCTNHEVIKGETVAHNYDSNFKCEDCGYQHTHTTTGYTYKDGTGHYKETTCTSHRKKKVEREEHVWSGDEDTVCDTCGYTRLPVHRHTWSSEYINDNEKGHYQMATCEGHTDQKSDYMDHVFEAGSDTCVCGYTRAADTSTALAADKKIYVVGDSTVCSYEKITKDKDGNVTNVEPSSDKYYLPRYGYGTQLHEYLNVQESQVVNLALSGRSSKSFLTEANYNTLKTEIKEGDYLIIGFGHNDEKSDDPARFASAKGDETVAGSFRNILYENYVKLAKDKGATPILCTPITRYDASGAYTGSKAHVTSDGDYPGAIKALGEATQTTVIDLTKLTVDLYKADNEGAKNFHAHTTYDGDDKATATPAGRDDTHINKYGAEMVCYMFANALKATSNPLAAQVITNKLAPAKGTHFPAAVREDYVKPVYNEFDPGDTTAANLVGDWFATVMGDVGGNDKVAYFTVDYDGASSKYTVGNKTGHGKIASASDGFAAAFMQIEKTKNFTVTAKVKVTNAPAASANSQSCYGIMLRDDIYINQYLSTVASNYVAAGMMHNKGAIFSRASGTLTQPSGGGAITVGETHELSIVRVGQAVTVKVDATEKVFTDFDFLSVDNDYMYICLFANRNVVAEFTEVKVEITGESQGA